MHIYCPRCGEPWDNDEFHDVENLSYKQAIAKFYSKGCGLVFGNKQCEERETERGTLSVALREVLGDDVDGIAAELEEYIK